MKDVISKSDPTLLFKALNSYCSTVANVRQQVQSVQKRVLDPRRPNRKPTSEEMEEWLFQYDPLVPDDPRRVISHNYKVCYVYVQ